MRSRIHLFLRGILAWLVLLMVVPPVSAQDPTPDPVLEIMDQLSPEAKVGQLVVVSFPDTNLGSDAEIVSLLRNYGLGGVILQPEHGNFGSERIEPSMLISMTNHLQQVVWDASLESTPRLSESGLTSFDSPYIPLLVAVESSVEGIHVTNFVSHTTDLPTSLALGASWNWSLAREAGVVLGQELAALGINFYMGPDLDVAYTPRPGDSSDLSTNSFGGDPFWVGVLGEAFIQGLRQGSEAKIFVVPRHLPGLGSVDRVLSEEVPTVQKSLEQLKQIELRPFFSVAAGEPGVGGVADAFLVTHIRYRGVQGSTRPISLDAQALQSVLNLDEISPWRAAGGVLIADNLGLQSVHRSYDPREGAFNARRVIQDALVAGNDLLILDRFSVDSDWDAHFANVRDVLEFLAARYKDDPTFKAIVDEAVYRIISMKMRVYDDFSLDAVQVDAHPASLQAVDSEGSGVSTQVALNALTLVFPLSEDLLPAPPQEGESIVVFTQERGVQLGSEKNLFSKLSPTAVSDALLRFYGPDGTGVIRPDAVQSFTFDELQMVLDVLDGNLPEAESAGLVPIVSAAIRDAQWVIFATTGLEPGDASGSALKEFLATQSGLLDARVMVLSFGTPYDLDSTEMSKLDLYYALYSPGDAFVDVGVRAFFHDLLAPGSSPVNIPALSYDVALQTQPEAGQIIPLNLVDSAGEELSVEARSEIRIGDVIDLRTGVIVDKNGHPVPDGTLIEFILSYPQEGTERIVNSVSQDGVGVAAVTLDRVGTLEIMVRAGMALSSVSLQLIVPEGGEVPPAITVITPTPTATTTPVLTPTATPTPPKTHQLPDPARLPAPRREYLLGWGFAGALFVLVLGFAWSRVRDFGANEAIRFGLSGVMGGLSSYIVFILIGHWWLPSWHYGLVGREFFAGIVVLAGGVVLLLLITLVLERAKDLFRGVFGTVLGKNEG